MSYIIITPAYNEQDYISKTIGSVLSQSVSPKAWVIVDDGSTDRTAEIIKCYTAEHVWIRYVHRSKDPLQSYYGSNVFAIHEGLNHASPIPYDYIAILDADISLPPNYYETIIGYMEQDARLGIASGVYENLIGGKLEPVLNDRRSAPKAIMVFRQLCFREIGGFLPLQYGGEDTMACVTARMKGWKVWSYPDVKAVHHRQTGTGNARQILKVRLTQGRAEWAMGSHWMFVLLKSLKRMIREKPYCIGGVCRWIGFLQGCLAREKRIVPDEVVKFFQKEQVKRLVSLNRCECT